MAQPPHTKSLPDWSSGLPEELLESIGKHLASGHDAASFRSTCSPWRDVVPFKSFAPLLLLPFSPESENVTFYSMSEEMVFSLLLPHVRGKVPCGSSCGWLALMNEAASVMLLNPFTGARVVLPPPDEHVAAASLTHVSKVDGRWVLHPANDYENTLASHAVKLDEMRKVFFHEIVLSSPPDVDGRECVAMAVLASSTEVAFCRVGVDSTWTLLDTYLECSVDSIVHFQERFLAVDCIGEISICGSITAGAIPTVMLMPSLSPPDELCHRSYLESDNELYLVGAILSSTCHRTRRFTYHTMIYKCNLLDRTPVWSRVEDVGDVTLFISKEFSDNFSGTSVSKYRRNNIYFSEPLYEDQNDWKHRLEIVDIATGTSEVLPFLEKMQRSEALCWIRPNPWKRGGLSKCNVEEPQQEPAPSMLGLPEPEPEPEPAGEVVKADVVQINST
ncbi:F-box protein SKIP23-like [Phragmites australis]|uniref:F-box protein SKIP23-like n=1 Tax=Phragmites australis TaxID=29695 RepID=UPI002D7A290E|nr:F-box protein SKIP23-like [Phragmites australis]